MATIEEIKSEILEDAEKEAGAITSDAQKKADDILAKAQQEAGRILKESREKCEKDASAIKKRSESAADSARRQALLFARQNAIDEVLEKAKNDLEAQTDGDYFKMIEELLKKSVHPKEGIICFGARDLDRMSEEFKDKIKTIAESAGGSLKIQTEAENIGSGFVLKYGGIEENCTLKALFAQKSDALRDRVNEILFGSSNG